MNWTGGTRTWAYPANGAPRPTSYTQVIAGGDRSTALTWRPDGRLATEATAGVTRTYGYDAAGQLTSDQDSAGPDLTYTYGPRGLRLSSSVDSVATAYTYDDKARLLTAGAQTFSYDADGRRTGTTDPAGVRTTAFDARGLPSVTTIDPASGPDITTTRTYDADRRLTTQSYQPTGSAAATWSYQWDSNRPAALPVEVRVDGTVWTRANYGTEFVGVSFSNEGTARYYAFDQRRSVVPNTANPSAPSDYDPYGRPSTDAAVQYGYRSELHHSDQIHLRNRDYEPATGTFTTPDPLDGIPGTTTETNPYHYADNDPLNRTDPLGLSPDDNDVDGGGGGADAAKICGLSVTVAVADGPQPGPADAVAAGICAAYLLYAATQVELPSLPFDDLPFDDDDDPGPTPEPTPGPKPNPPRLPRPPAPFDPCVLAPQSCEIVPVWFGQRRISSEFGAGGSIGESPSGVVRVFTDPRAPGVYIAESNRTLAAYSLAGATTAPACMMSSVSSSVRNRLNEGPLPPQSSLPSPVVPVTRSITDLTLVPPFEVRSTVSVRRSLRTC